MVRNVVLKVLEFSLVLWRSKISGISFRRELHGFDLFRYDSGLRLFAF